MIRTSFIYPSRIKSRVIRKFFLIIFGIPIIGCSQNDSWQFFSNEDKTSVYISETKTYEINDLVFDVAWDKELSYSEKIGYYGGIKSLFVYKDNKKVQTLNNIEDNIALGYIYFEFYDFNLDGHLDFRIPINSRWKRYYIFNSQINKFVHREDWDYLRIQKIDTINKRIISVQDRNYIGSVKLYQIKGLELIEIGQKSN